MQHCLWAGIEVCQEHIMKGLVKEFSFTPGSAKEHNRGLKVAQTATQTVWGGIGAKETDAAEGMSY